MAQEFGQQDERATLEQARRRCERLIEQLRQDAQLLERPSRLVGPEAMAEGRAAYEDAAAAAEALLRELTDELHRA
jgi:hypothetical protein